MDIQFTHSTYQSWFDKLNLTTQQIEMLSIELTRLIDREKPGFEVDYKAGTKRNYNNMNIDIGDNYLMEFQTQQNWIDYKEWVKNTLDCEIFEEPEKFPCVGWNVKSIYKYDQRYDEQVWAFVYPTNEATNIYNNVTINNATFQ